MPILVTAFEPFDSGLNASQEVLTSLKEQHPTAFLNTRIHYEVLPCRSQQLTIKVEQLFHHISPNIWLLLGQASNQHRILIERFALNILDFSRPDNVGFQPKGIPVINNAPLAYQSTLPNMAQITHKLKNYDISVGISNHAGTYLCNQAFFHVLHLTAYTKKPVLCGFIHLPLLPEQCLKAYCDAPNLNLQTSLKAVQIMLKYLLYPKH